MNEKKAEELRLKGNKCVNNKSWAEALLHYSHAIKLHSSSAKLFCNRSLAFLKLQQYYYAIEDAKQTIDLDQNWFKGYFRRGEVEYECGLYEEALKSYHLALHFLRDGDENSKNEHQINAAIKRSMDCLSKQRTHDYQIPWIGAALGLVAGMALITWDYVSHYAHPIVRHPILKLFIIAIVSLIFFLLAKWQRSYTKNYRQTLLKPPLDLFNQDS